MKMISVTGTVIRDPKRSYDDRTMPKLGRMEKTEAILPIQEKVIL